MTSNYWDVRHSNGRTSGNGSIGCLRDFKWEKIEEHVGKVNDVIDVGCGDLSFWDGRDCDNYVGIDCSEVVIQKNIVKRPKWNFITSRSDNTMVSMLCKADVVFCFDMLFHIMEDDVYENTIENLTRFSKKHVFIYTWVKNPFVGFGGLKRNIRNKDIRSVVKSVLKTVDSDFKYQKYRDFDKSIKKLSDLGFELKSIDTNENIDEYGALYFFSKR